MVDCRELIGGNPSAKKPLSMDNSKQEDNTLATGTVVEALPNTMFRVEFEDGSTQIVYLAGKMRLHRIKVLVGDKVTIKLDPYGGKGRVVKRL